MLPLFVLNLTCQRVKILLGLVLGLAFLLLC